MAGFSMRSAAPIRRSVWVLVGMLVLLFCFMWVERAWAADPALDVIRTSGPDLQYAEIQQDGSTLILSFDKAVGSVHPDRILLNRGNEKIRLSDFLTGPPDLVAGKSIVIFHLNASVLPEQMISVEMEAGAVTGLGGRSEAVSTINATNRSMDFNGDGWFDVEDVMMVSDKLEPMKILDCLSRILPRFVTRVHTAG